VKALANLSLALYLGLVSNTLSLTAKPEQTAASYFQRGLEAIRRGAFSEAEAQINAGLQLEPSSPAGYDLLGIAYDGLERHVEAERAFREALKLNPRFVPARNDLGRSLYQRGMVQAAEQEFKQTLLIDSQNFTASYNLGLLARDAKRYAESAQYLEKARQASPADIPTLFTLCGAYLGAGQTDRAISAAGQLVAINPGNPQIRFSLGTLFLEWKQYAEAAEHLERARINAPRNFELLHNLGQAYNHLKKYTEAEDAFLQALSIQGDSVETLYQLAVVYAQSGHPDQAIQILVRARQLAPKRPDVLLLLGRECIQEGFVDDAIEVLQDCAAIDAGKVEPHLLLGEAYTQKKRFADALREYQTLVALEPSNPQGQVLLGRTFRYLGQYSDAERVLHHAIKLDASNSQAAYYLGLVESDRMDYSSAQRWFELALKSDPKYLGALYQMAVVCMKTSEDSRARDYLQRARAVAPTFSEVYYRLSVVYQRLKEPKLAAEARDMFKKYEQLDAETRKYFSSGVLEFVQQTQDLPPSQRLERYRQELLKTEKFKPDDLNLLFMLVQVDFRLGLRDEALQRLERIGSLQPDNMEVQLRSASLLTVFNYYLEALRQLQTLVDKQPSSQQARFALASLHFQMRRGAEALQVLKAGETSADNSATYHHLLGRILVQQERVPEGLKHLHKALDLEPENEEYLADLVLELSVAGERSEAQNLLNRAKVKFPASGRIRFAEGIWYQLSTRKSEAMVAFRQAADFSWQWEVPHLAQASLLLQSGSIAESQDVLEQTATLFPTSPWPHWLKGLAVLKNPETRPSQSILEMRESLSLASNRPEILPALLASSLQQRDCETAREVWKRMTTFGLAAELDATQLCASETSAPVTEFSLPARIADQYSGVRWLLDLAQSTFR
jgi:tetratricopeptide (TPR) repeat protein